MQERSQTDSRRVLLPPRMQAQSAVMLAEGAEEARWLERHVGSRVARPRHRAQRRRRRSAAAMHAAARHFQALSLLTTPPRTLPSSRVCAAPSPCHSALDAAHAAAAAWLAPRHGQQQQQRRHGTPHRRRRQPRQQLDARRRVLASRSGLAGGRGQRCIWSCTHGQPRRRGSTKGPDAACREQRASDGHVDPRRGAAQGRLGHRLASSCRSQAAATADCSARATCTG